MSWIKVEERVPEHMQDIWILHDGVRERGYYSRGMGRWNKYVDDGRRIVEVFGVTGWAEILATPPPAPKKKVRIQIEGRVTDTYGQGEKRGLRVQVPTTVPCGTRVWITCEIEEEEDNPSFLRKIMD
jgi:hypothetical protein